MDKKLKELIDETLKTTEPLAVMGASHDTKFINVILGIFRVSFCTLRDIYYLSSEEETGASTLDLARKIMEYGINVEYMIWKGKEEYAEKFQKYLFVEMHNEIEFQKLLNPNFVKENKVEEGYEEMEKEYALLNTKTKERKNWAGISIDQMVEDLLKAGKIKEFESSRIDQAYIWGCRLNHASPFVVQKYLDPEYSKNASNFYLRMAITFSILFHLRMATRYIDEMRELSNSNVHQDIADKVNSLYKELESLNSD